MIGKRKIKRFIQSVFEKTYDSEEVRFFLNKKSSDYKKIRLLLDNDESPYKTSSHKVLKESGRPIFITGRFRSGSTLVWQLFRNMPNTTAYYEPFNERRWFEGQDKWGNLVDSSHRGVTDYWREYNGKEHIGRWYDEGWIRHSLYMDELSYNPEMKRYISSLIESAGKKAVLQFNRVDFRLPWLKQNFSNAAILHIYRNPRDQWCSTLGEGSNYRFDTVDTRQFNDRYYLIMWYRDLCKYFPFLSEYDKSHRYYLFYLIWKLSYMFGKKYSDVSISYEDLVNNPYLYVNKLASLADIEQSHDNSLAKLIDTKSTSKWIDYGPAEWFNNVESECEATLDEFFGLDQKE